MSQSQAEAVATDLVQSHPRADRIVAANSTPQNANDSSVVESIYSLWGPNDHFNSWRQNAWRSGPYLRQPSHKIKRITKDKRPELRRVKGAPGTTVRLVAYKETNQGSIARANMMTCPSIGSRSYDSFDESHRNGIPRPDEYDLGDGRETGESVGFCGHPNCQGGSEPTWQEELQRCEDRKDHARRREYLREMDAYAEIGRARRGERGQNNWGSYHPDGNQDLPAVAPYIAGHGLRSRDVVRSMLPHRRR